MKLSDVDWVLKHPEADELRMSGDTVNQMGAAMASAGMQMPGQGFKYATLGDAIGRPIRVVESLAGRRVVIAQLPVGVVQLLKAGAEVARVELPGT